MQNNYKCKIIINDGTNNSKTSAYIIYNYKKYIIII